MKKRIANIIHSIIIPILWLTAAVLIGALIGTIVGRLIQGTVNEPTVSPYAIAFNLNDSYHPTANVETTSITLVTDADAVAAKLAKYNEGRSDVAYALAVYTEAACTIYVSEPEGRNDIEGLSTLGHEVLHCFRGCYHDGGCTERILAKE